jgi:hypothetical protein
VSLASEIRRELAGVLSGRVGVADGVLPPLAFVGVQSLWGLSAGAVAGIGSALAIIAWRLSRGRALRFAAAGLAGTLAAVGLALRSGSAQDYFLPGLISGALTSVVVLVSIVARRPFVGWASWLTRGWPLGWYWHPRVRPAYTRTTWIWLVFFTGRTVVQWRLYSAGDSELLAVARVAMGWPALLLLLIATYVLGRRWLTALGGPSVVEFEADEPPPWQCQPAGF